MITAGTGGVVVVCATLVERPAVKFLEAPRSGDDVAALLEISVGVFVIVVAVVVVVVNIGGVVVVTVLAGVVVVVALVVVEVAVVVVVTVVVAVVVVVTVFAVEVSTGSNSIALIKGCPFTLMISILMLGSKLCTVVNSLMQ